MYVIGVGIVLVKTLLQSKIKGALKTWHFIGRFASVITESEFLKTACMALVLVYHIHALWKWTPFQGTYVHPNQTGIT